MLRAERSLAVIIAWCILIGVDSSIKSCPKAAVVNLTGETPNNFGSVNKTGDLFPPQHVWDVNSETFGCPCGFETCFPVCSKTGILSQEDERTLKISYREKAHMFMSDPDCSVTVELLSTYEPLQDGSLRGKNTSLTIDMRRYCLLLDRNTSIWSVLVCQESVIPAPRYSGTSAMLLVICTIISTIFFLATFTVYTVVPELRNLQGLIFRCYLASYISCRVLFLIIAVVLPFEHDVGLQIVIVVFDAYLLHASMLWLNVMSFDIWQKFRNLKSSVETCTEKRQKQKFLHYSIYVWVVPALHVSVATCRKALSPSRFGSDPVMIFLLIFPVVCVIVCNSILYTSTALKIRQMKKDTTDIVGGLNKHQRESEQWFNLYVKLFMLMEGPLIFWAVGIYLKNEIFGGFLCTIEALQGIVIFFMFTWKEDVKQSIRYQFTEMFRKLISFHRCTPTPPAIDSGIEELAMPKMVAQKDSKIRSE